MDAARPTAYDADAGPRRRAQERLYVLFQTAGWSFFLLIQLVFVRVFESGSHAERGVAGAVVQSMAIGLLVTHFAREWIHRRGWKHLGWKALTPRILALAVVLDAIWILTCYGIRYGILRYGWPHEYHPLALICASLVNGFILMIGWLCVYFFYHALDRSNRLQIEQLRLVATVKEAELRALKSQINPHFIFNSLNSLRGLIDEDPDRARQAVTQLANLLRYSLQSGQLETVAFEDELNTVNDYLALEQVRHEERLRVRVDVAPGVAGWPVPPMLLQTLVENAVKYGIAPLREGGEIGITARCEQDTLLIQVTNPGSLSTKGTSTGVGLRNAAERLRLLFGDRATLHLREERPGRVVAEVLVPTEGRMLPGGARRGEPGRRETEKVTAGA